MTLVLLSFLGGILTILSPCILPVLPFVFARAEQPFLKSGLPLLGGMAVSFAGVATLAAVGGSWAVRANQYGRVLALILLALFAITLLSTHLAELVARPFVGLGNRLSQTGADGTPRVGLWNSLLLGIATGLLWAPCAGPILGLVLTGAALSGPNTQTTLLLFAYAAGAAVSLAVAMSAGARLFRLMKRSLAAGVWIRRGLGIAVLVGVTVIALGLDSGVLTRLSYASTNGIEQTLVRSISPTMAGASQAQLSDAAADASSLPSLEGASLWLNSPPLTPESLRGKVVVVDFWTYSCINCLRSLPYVKDWYERYKDHGLVVIGVHAPEFAFEKSEANVRRAVTDLGISYPVALDNSFAIWQRFNNQYWPAHYFIDAKGRIRGHHFGEGDYVGSEQAIRQLLMEAGQTDLPPAISSQPRGNGVEESSDPAHVQSPETYLGYQHGTATLAGQTVVEDRMAAYQTPTPLPADEYAYGGNWSIGPEASTAGTGATLSLQFEAKDVYLVLGGSGTVRVSVNGKPTQTVTVGGEPKLYQLVGSTRVQQALLSLSMTPGVQAYDFTFG